MINCHVCNFECKDDMEVCPICGAFLLREEETQETKENCVDKMSDRVAELLDSFRESYGYYNDFYEKMKENIRNDNIENPE